MQPKCEDMILISTLLTKRILHIFRQLMEHRRVLQNELQSLINSVEPIG